MKKAHNMDRIKCLSLSNTQSFKSSRCCCFLGGYLRVSGMKGRSSSFERANMDKEYASVCLYQEKILPPISVLCL